ncbi:tetratricopeptide repeat-containing sensor histidine kinase [Flagellimonas pacifica]|uniref:Tetratricopeptide repeat-containing protein n=1 Tax=Flagellimonas pacifica TaxID=1247520 RepID=A0A285MUZ6_9FLAO|nr:histidine kinase [Allomuricauda parva]SNZ01012.1 Tetratricopeptide repeat-containing protein [Allomuricauda parva]
MIKKRHVVFLFLIALYSGFSQVNNNSSQVEIKGSVKGKENFVPISGVQVSTDTGSFTTTNGLGEFKIKASIGDYLIFESPEFETVRHRIKSDEDVDVRVAGYEYETSKKEKRSSSRNMINHQKLLDSADFYKRTDLEKSIDFIAQSITLLGKRGNKKELASSFTTLGEIYLYHKQYDLAITNFEDALATQKSIKPTLLLGKAYILNNDFQKAESSLLPLVSVKNMVPYQRVELYEGLGDTYRALSDLKKALDFYQEGLQIAQKNQISPKVIDLNSKIADAYASEDRFIEAEGFYNNSLNLSKAVAPERLIEENEKVADFYNDENRYDDEIQLRKKSLNELQQLPIQSVATENKGLGRPDSITSQRINYKIANAYIAQDKLDEAIPYLERSIVEADNEDDLVVQKDATRKLSEVYRYKGDFTKALESYQDYVAVVDSLYVRKEQEISRAARFNREIATKQNRISSLEQERELSQSKYSLALTEQQLFEETSKRQKWIIYSLIFGIVLMTLITFLYYRNGKQQKLANNLLALKSLRTQMNPHFIFNALNSVNNYIAKSDERSANRFLSDFSVLMRSVLENSEEDFIPLSRELELLELYVKLEHSRFSDKFDFEIDINDKIDIEAFEIPPMLLQPYIENAIWHGLRYKEEKGFLKIKIDQINAETLEINIEDNGVGRKRSAELKTANQKKQKSKGMGNIKKRIQILNDMYKNKVDVSISDLYDDQTGTKVSLKLKKD